jgi:hypothetical protein
MFFSSIQHEAKGVWESVGKISLQIKHLASDSTNVFASATL